MTADEVRALVKKYEDATLADFKEILCEQVTSERMIEIERKFRAFAKNEGFTIGEAMSGCVGLLMFLLLAGEYNQQVMKDVRDGQN
jgi:hypothetical protein